VVWDGESGASELLDQADSRMYRDKRPGPAGRYRVPGRVPA
jgi:hypothetical protein